MACGYGKLWPTCGYKVWFILLLKRRNMPDHENISKYQRIWLHLYLFIWSIHIRTDDACSAIWSVQSGGYSFFIEKYWVQTHWQSNTLYICASFTHITHCTRSCDDTKVSLKCNYIIPHTQTYLQNTSKKKVNISHDHILSYTVVRPHTKVTDNLAALLWGL